MGLNGIELSINSSIVVVTRIKPVSMSLVNHMTTDCSCRILIEIMNVSISTTVSLWRQNKLALISDNNEPIMIVEVML